MRNVFCLACGDNCCLHLQQSRRTAMLTPREIGVLVALTNPLLHTGKEIAFSLGITPATFKVYMSKIYAKLGWKDGGSIRLATLWALAYRDKLGAALPMPEQFKRPEAA